MIAGDISEIEKPEVPRERQGNEKRCFRVPCDGHAQGIALGPAPVLCYRFKDIGRQVPSVRKDQCMLFGQQTVREQRLQDPGRGIVEEGINALFPDGCCPRGPLFHGLSRLHNAYYTVFQTY